MPLAKQSLPDAVRQATEAENLNLPHHVGIFLPYDTQTTTIHFQLDLDDTDYLF